MLKQGKLMIKKALGIFFFVGFFICTSCSDDPLKPQCYQAPAPKDFGMTSTRQSQESNLNIELSPSYMRERIRSLIETPDEEDGVNVITSKLVEEKVVGGEKLNILSIDIQPWLKGASGPTVIQRYFQLRLKLVPYLITSDTIPDNVRRHNLLCSPSESNCSGDSGVLLTFTLQDFLDKSFNESVSCSSKNYDLVTAAMSKKLYKKLDEQKPLPFSIDPIVKMISEIYKSPTKLEAISIGTDEWLKIGLRMDKGDAKKFDSSYALLEKFGDRADWGIDIDTTLISAGIKETVRKEAEKSAAPQPVRVTDDNIQISYIGNGCSIKVSGELLICGDIPFTSSVIALMSICKNSSGKSVLKVCSGNAQTDNQASLAQKACYLFDSAFRDFVGSFSGGLASAVVSNGDKCPALAELEFTIDKGLNDIFYATELDTKNKFYIAGRSTFLDRINSQHYNVTRPSAPPPCQ